MKKRCDCRLCTYDREFAKRLARVPLGDRPFFEDLKSRWEHADFDLCWADAQRIEAQRAGTTEIGPVEDESRVGNADAP
jgi:hypothetical protein